MCHKFRQEVFVFSDAIFDGGLFRFAERNLLENRGTVRKFTHHSAGPKECRTRGMQDRPEMTLMQSYLIVLLRRGCSLTAFQPAKVDTLIPSAIFHSFQTELALWKTRQ